MIKRETFWLFVASMVWGAFLAPIYAVVAELDFYREFYLYWPKALIMSAFFGVVLFLLSMGSKKKMGLSLDLSRPHGLLCLWLFVFVEAVITIVGVSLITEFYGF